MANQRCQRPQPSTSMIYFACRVIERFERKKQGVVLDDLRRKHTFDLLQVVTVAPSVSKPVLTDRRHPTAYLPEVDEAITFITHEPRGHEVILKWTYQWDYNKVLKEIAERLVVKVTCDRRHVYSGSLEKFRARPKLRKQVREGELRIERQIGLHRWEVFQMTRDELLGIAA